MHNIAKTFVAQSLIVLLLLGFPVLALTADPPPQFPTQQQAHQRCPTDTVVWLNLPTGVYHFNGQRWYGKTKSGAYVCRLEADKAGEANPMISEQLQQPIVGVTVRYSIFQYLDKVVRDRSLLAAETIQASTSRADIDSFITRHDLVG